MDRSCALDLAGENETMKAARIHASGPRSVIVIEDNPIRFIGESQLLVRVHAFGVGWAEGDRDLIWRKVRGDDAIRAVDAVLRNNRVATKLQK